ncbi:MAG TPA: hypothetical protein VHX16_17965 [Chloroflexota bacterium]|nr:hypothetical protein [Chloroflexota bacterium]
MRSFRRLMVTPLLMGALGWISLGTGVASVHADDKEIGLRGLVDCGAKVETRCDIKDSFFFWTDGYSGSSQRIQVDVTWIKPDRMPSIDQEDELCLTGFGREDQVFQATSINEQCDEGTVNDREELRDKKQENKDRNKN